MTVLLVLSWVLAGILYIAAGAVFAAALDEALDCEEDWAGLVIWFWPIVAFAFLFCLLVYAPAALTRRLYKATRAWVREKEEKS